MFIDDLKESNLSLYDDNDNDLDLSNCHDSCPLHDSPVTREYEFGMGDAIVYTYSCGCASCVSYRDSGEVATYHDSYLDAKSTAIMTKQLNAVW